MNVEGMRQSAPVEPVRLDPKKQAGDAGRELIKAGQEQKEQKEQKNDIQEVGKAINLLNKTMETYNTELKFTLHEKSGEYMVKVVNTKDNTVIREIPPERILDMVAQLKEMLGLIVDKFI
ncbi:MAG: flagellar protein FlaG [Bacillota bacterium]